MHETVSHKPAVVPANTKQLCGTAAAETFALTLLGLCALRQERASPSPSLHRMVDKYELIEKVGEGNFGEVHQYDICDCNVLAA